MSKEAYHRCHTAYHVLTWTSSDRILILTPHGRNQMPGFSLLLTVTHDYLVTDRPRATDITMGPRALGILPI